MKKEEAFLQLSESQINSSTSSYSEIIPRQENLGQVKKDKPIIMRSIPMNKQKQPIRINQDTQEQKKQIITQISSSHAKTKLSQQTISAEVYKSSIKNSKHFSTPKDNRNEQKQQKYLDKQGIFNEKLLKSTSEQYQQNHSPSTKTEIQTKKQQKKQRENDENVVLDLSYSSINSQKPQSISPKQPFKMYLQFSPQKSQKPSSSKEQDLKIYLDAIKQMRKQEKNKNTPIKLGTFQLQALMKKNHELEARIIKYEEFVKNETESMIIERKANQIYTDFYHTLSKMITKFLVIKKDSFFFSNNDFYGALNQSLNMEKILQIVDKLIGGFSNKPSYKTPLSFKQVQTDPFKIEFSNESPLKLNEYTHKIHQLEILLQKAEQKNSQLRNELLQSTQNNINAIFNSQISASCCLQNQVTKINSEMAFLKQKMNFLLQKNQPTYVNPQYLPPQIIYLSQPSKPPANPFNEKKENNMVKIYTTKSKGHESDDESEGVQENEHKKRRHSLSRKRKRSSRSDRSQSSMSSKSTKKRQQLSIKQIQNLKQAYSQTKDELNSLIHTFSLITTSQNEMKGCFSQIKDEIIKIMNEKRKQQVEEMSKKQKLKEESYISNIETMKQQRQQDRKVIQNLNQKVIELLNTITVPQKVSQEHLKPYFLDADQIPFSQISVSVEYLKLIEQLKIEKQKQLQQIEALMKQNNFLKDEIIQLKNIEQRSKFIKNFQDSPKSSNECKQSIINELNGFTEMYLPPPPFLITTGLDYHINHDRKSTKTLQSNKHVTFNNNVSSNKFIPSMQKIESQKLVRVQTESQKNLENNFKIVLQSKENHIKSLEQAIVNLQQTIQYLKGEIISKEQVIEELEIYVSNLENRSLNSISLSSPQINMPEANLYIDPLNTSDQIKQKYENYVKNLKIILKETRNQNKILREQLHTLETQIDQQTVSNFNLKNSATHSERTTKNFPSSCPVHSYHVKTDGQNLIKKRVDNLERYENERQEQRINSLAYDNEIPDEIDRARIKSKFPTS